MKLKINVYYVLFLIVSLLTHSSAMGAQLVAGEQTYTSTFNSGGFTNVSLTPIFDQVPVILVLPTTQGGDPSNVRIRNITTSSFEAAPTEPHRQDGPHVAMQSTSIAVDKGNFTLPTTPTETKFEVGTVSTSIQQFGEAISGTSAWYQVNFNVPFSAPPIVVASIQTLNNEIGESNDFPPNVSSLPFLDVAISDITTTGFKVALERSEAENGSVTVDEIIGYMAMDETTGTFIDSNSDSVTFKAFSYSGARGHTNTCVTSSFPGGAFSATPIVIASKRTRNNPDGGWVRRCSLSSSQIGIEIDEDRETEGDNERSLSVADSESISVIAFSSGFTLGSLETYVPTLEVLKNSVVLSDPVNGTTSPKAIPGAIIEYSITVTNTGQGAADAGTFEVNDAVPANTSLVVSGLNCMGAINHLDSSSPTDSGLACDVVEFAKADGVFGHTPVASGSNNTDSLVRFIRIKPANEFKASTGSGSPNITFKFRVELN